MELVLSLVALVVALAALGLVLRDRRTPPAPVSEEPVDVTALRTEVAELRGDVDRSLRHLTVVRYDAFADVGGRMSWSAAILDDEGSGLVLTSIHGRSETRSYAKGVRDWSGEQQLSPEEEQAVRAARQRPAS